MISTSHHYIDSNHFWWIWTNISHWWERRKKMKINLKTNNIELALDTQKQHENRMKNEMNLLKHNHKIQTTYMHNTHTGRKFGKWTDGKRLMWIVRGRLNCSSKIKHIDYSGKAHDISLFIDKILQHTHSHIHTPTHTHTHTEADTCWARETEAIAFTHTHRERFSHSIVHHS